MPATYLWFLFDWRGRIGRNAYRFALLALAVMISALKLAPIEGSALLLGVVVLQLVVSMALDAKRLHDAGFSASTVVLTNLACVALLIFLFTSSPDATAAMGAAFADTIGAQAASSLPFCAILAGSALGAGLRAPMLAIAPTSPAGEIYAYDPRARFGAARGEQGTKLDADALIAQALAARRLQDAAIALSDIGRAGRREPTGARKSFGRRVA